MSRHHNSRSRSRHHRKEVSHGGTNEPRNISDVSQKAHRAFHTLFGNLEPFEIMKVLNDVWIDPDYEFVLRRKVPYVDSVIHNW